MRRRLENSPAPAAAARSEIGIAGWREACLSPPMLTRFSVAPLHTLTRTLAAVARERLAPDLVLTGARILSTFTELVLRNREVWIKSGRIAAIRTAGRFRASGLGRAKVYDVQGGILAPGLVEIFVLNAKASRERAQHRSRHWVHVVHSYSAAGAWCSGTSTVADNGGNGISTE